ncbi:hypothetical protein I3843_09G094300 [Carya illinoinensis]|uniref:Cytochrome b561 domain-containing protein n=2 Tax=Carya illinoinensis TaxID=32201 RepID=A0A8T1PAR9_CARIL|nr:cytochrome b561 and DOMON domain-containing protein At5g35735-like [Carya illinoinensis]KAG6641746.1 hypothetical protein CIPAW_09G096300 [Carya illinoinensis]KAG7962959.1 hypothetical protein I3843_09G094300 [Carya illinoinensis]
MLQIVSGESMNSHCIMILSMVFPLQYSITAQASSWNGGLPLIQTERGIDSIVADVMLQMHATSLQSSNSTGVTINLRSGKAARHFRHHHHLKNVQGVLIIIGWGTMLPIGVMIARYFKNFPIAWSEWYSVHIIFQGIGYTLGTIGWGIGICLENTLRLHISKAQRVLSIIVFICTTIQMLAIFWQPKKEAEHRRCWEVYHHFLGYAVIVLIITNIFLGINDEDQAEKWRWVYGVILGVLALIALALETYRWIKSNQLRQANSNMFTFP